MRLLSLLKRKPKDEFGQEPGEDAVGLNSKMLNLLTFPTREGK